MTVRVLIVDDQEPFRMAARMVVDATDGFDVVGEAETGEDSVTMAAELQPDLVLMDVNLPGINGLDATRQILSGSDTVVVLLLSTYEEEEYAPQGRRVRGGVLHPQGGVRPRPARRRLGGRERSPVVSLRLPPVDRRPTPETTVPLPGAEVTCSEPPTASSRSCMPWMPVPGVCVCGSKPTPSSRTSKVSEPLDVRSRSSIARCLRVLRHVLHGFQHAEVHGRLRFGRIASDAVGVHAHGHGDLASPARPAPSPGPCRRAAAGRSRVRGRAGSPAHRSCPLGSGPASRAPSWCRGRSTCRPAGSSPTARPAVVARRRGCCVRAGAGPRPGRRPSVGGTRGGSRSTPRCAAPTRPGRPCRGSAVPARGRSDRWRGTTP